MDNSNTNESIVASVASIDVVSQDEQSGIEGTNQNLPTEVGVQRNMNKICRESYNAYMKDYMKQRRKKIKLQNIDTIPINTKKERMKESVTPAFLEQFQDYLKTGEDIVTSPTNDDKEILTIRYTNDTYNEVKTYCETHSKNSWIYSTEYMPKNIQDDAKFMFMIEMNNTTNQITGIGMTRTKLSDMKRRKYRIHEVVEKNNYQITTTCRKNRSEMNTFEETVMNLLDNICFKNRGHHKNLKGIASFSVDCGFDLVEFFTVMMRIHVHSRKIVHSVLNEIIHDIIALDPKTDGLRPVVFEDDAGEPTASARTASG